MKARHQSSAEQEFDLDIQAATVAQACQDVLKELASVKSISRESGIINGEISNGMTNPSVISIHISRITESRTKLKVSLVRKEGWVTSGHGAQDNLASFADALVRHPRIAGKTTTGW